MTTATRGALLATARTLSIDRAAAEVTAAFDERGVDCMLVKGVAVVRALYGDGGRRTYSDCDLLVRERDVAPASAALTALGFERAADEESGVMAELLHAHTWTRSRDRAAVDLHWTFVGVEAPPERLFAALRRRAVHTRLAGRDVPIAGASTTALLAVLQLLQHGRIEGSKFEIDVQRALEVLGPGDWDDAAALAAEVGAERAFGTGLRLVPKGRAMAARLGLPDDAVARTLAAGTEDDMRARAFEAVARRPGFAGKLKLLLWLLLPPRAYVEMLHPSARRGAAHLAWVYAVRPFSLASRAPATLGAWRRARRAQHG